MGHELRPGARHLFGEVRCATIEQLQRDALESPRPQVVVKVDRSGLNEHHPMVQRLYAAIDRVIRPIVEAEERRAGAHRLSATKPVAARDLVGLRMLNDVLKRAFDSPGARGLLRGTAESRVPPLAPGEKEPRALLRPSSSPARPGEAELMALRFARSPLCLHPGEQRGASLLIDPARVAPGTAVTVTSDPGIGWKPWGEAVVPARQPSGWSRLSGTVRARVTTEPGSRLTMTAQAGTESAALEVLVVRHRAAGWVREIARKDEDAEVEAEFDPETGVVTVYEGRKEFRTLERAARRAGFGKRRIREYCPTGCSRSRWRQMPSTRGLLVRSLRSASTRLMDPPTRRPSD